ncbi:MAG: TerC/Alx family metal homeostasis membrane protein [Phycisphaerae bacterium]|nr:TerC/Alx family metal homeostasis membrane protein [Phycisphaerae bacterium]
MTIWLWVGFIAFVIGLLALDLGVFNRKAHVVSMREALGWTIFWVVLSLGFNALVFYMYEHHWLDIGLGAGQEPSGHEAALKFFTGYVIEKSLSLDNIFVIALIFTYFRVPPIHQHRVLFWGILGALVMRGAMILAGVALIERFDWVVYVFGALLLITAVKLLVTRHDSIEPERNPLVKLVRRFYPVTPDFRGKHFFDRVDGRIAVTPLFIALLVVESSDLLFAVDSIPAIFAVTHDPFLVFTSNIFAILGLRSLYFALAGIMHRFRYVSISLVFVLAYIGVKMILSHHYPVPAVVTLAVVGGLVSVGILASLLAGTRDPSAYSSPVTHEIEEIVQYTWRQARKIVVIVIGSTVLLVGIALIVLPGPALVVIPIGLAILGTEFVWARRILKRMKEEGMNLAQAIGLKKESRRPQDGAGEPMEGRVPAASEQGPPAPEHPHSR